MKPSKRKALTDSADDRLTESGESIKARIRAKDGTSVPGDQAAVRECRNTLQRADEKYRTANDAAWAEQYLAGPKGIAGRVTKR